MEVRHLELLRELADRGSLAAVAAATHRTPSAVSQQLRTAERDVGMRLVEPDGRGLRLTAAGRLLADGAVAVATALGEVQRDLDELRGEPTGVVRIASLPSAAEVLVPPLLGALRGTRVTIELDDLDIAEADFAPQTADYDIVIGHSMARRPRTGQRLLVVPLAREPLDVAVPATHPLAGRSSVAAADLAGQPWVGVPLGYPFDDLRIAIENRAGGALDVRHRVRDNRLVESLVAVGEGLALLPRYTTRPRDGVVTLPITDVRSSRTVLALARPDRAERAVVTTVLEHLRGIGRRLTQE
ncbi:transcriptional regulator [Intrasporangium chromatireducens Q5-1]|uniref:Transcriptional regulator n=1 Tax=Intrasporangium chromatireducens Q5-1 TaxID=584657 RepID=W9GR35_9MICO|nr:LysR family transcriptional regulator [Intrasporangium chromatireducens]EWT07492.1 transcriptional regulator [Intrasporangium chromatireducens Q5-1]